MLRSAELRQRSKALRSTERGYGATERRCGATEQTLRCGANHGASLRCSVVRSVPRSGCSVGHGAERKFWLSGGMVQASLHRRRETSQIPYSDMFAPRTRSDPMNSGRLVIV